jgi:tellurite resistance protein
MLTQPGTPMISPHAAIIYTLVMVSAADRNMKTAELTQIGRFVTQLPAFADYDAGRIVETAQECAVMLQVENGMERTLAQVAAALPPHLRETAYLLACEVAAIDERIPLEEMRMLQKIRQALDLDRLTSAALERATQARLATA